MRQKVLKLGEAVGETAKGKALAKQMDERMAMLEAKLSQIPDSKRKTVVAFNFLSAMGRKGDLIDSMMNKAHIINGVAQIPTELATGYISKEQVVRVNPDIFFLATWYYDNKHNVDEYVAQITNDPAYKDVKAIKNNQIKFVTDKYRYVASHHIVDAVEEFAKAVYPELF
jgi:iron complex transport system substrate-binding protein